MGNSGIPGQLTLSFERSKISDNPFPVINSKDGDGDGGEVVVAIETEIKNLVHMLFPILF